MLEVHSPEVIEARLGVPSDPFLLRLVVEALVPKRSAERDAETVPEKQCWFLAKLLPDRLVGHEPRHQTPSHTSSARSPRIASSLPSKTLFSRLSPPCWAN